MKQKTMNKIVFASGLGFLGVACYKFWKQYKKMKEKNFFSDPSNFKSVGGASVPNNYELNPYGIFSR